MMNERDKEFWDWYYSTYLTEIEKARIEWEKEMNKRHEVFKAKEGIFKKNVAFKLPSPEKIDPISEALVEIITPRSASVISKLVEGSILLRRLSSIHVPMYRAAASVWQEDFRDICRKLDSSGISEGIANYASEELERFSLEEHGNEIAEGLGLSNLMSQWGVSDEKVAQYWHSIEKRKNKHFIQRGLPIRFEIGHFVNPERQILESPVAFRKWNELSPFDWGKFCSYVAIGLGALAGGPIGVAGIIAGSAYLSGEDDDD